MKISGMNSKLDPSLSRRLYRALTAGNEELFQIIEDPSMEVLGTALKNPAFNEKHLLALLQRRDLSGELLRALYRSPMVEENRQLKVALVRNPCSPAHVTMALIPYLQLFELVDISYIPGVAPDQKLAVERAIIQRLPFIPLGDKITLARRGTSLVVDALLREGDSRYLETCLDNPRLKESSIFSFLNGPNSTAEGISIVARHPRWKIRPNLQLAILKNPKTPEVWFTLFLPHLSVNDVKGVLASKKISQTQKKMVREELKRRGL